jgi:hypothetical protein
MRPVKYLRDGAHGVEAELIAIVVQSRGLKRIKVLTRTLSRTNSVSFKGDEPQTNRDVDDEADPGRHEEESLAPE